VLATFRLEQTGDKLRVIDSDGSTYTGAISLPASVASYGTAVEMKNEPLRPDSAPVSQPTSAPAGIASQSRQNYYFRVTGTNRTLQQPVVFAGNIQVLTNVPPVGQTAVTQLPVTQNQNQFTPAQNQLPSLLNSTISGNVRLGTNQEMQINAVPVNP
jgi:hypothetical protein